MKIITTHKSTDFDGLASLVAASLIYPEATVVVPKQLNQNVKAFLSIHKDIFVFSQVDNIDWENVTGLVVVDANSWQRLEKSSNLKQKKKLEIIVWDHHTKGDINASWACCQPIGATITLLIDEIKRKKIQLSPIQSTLFLMGIYEDTNSLTFPSSTAKDAYAVGYLLENGADLAITKQFLRPLYGEKQKNILFEMLKLSPRDKINGYSVSINKIDISGHVPNLSIVLHMYKEVVNVDAAFGIFSDKDKARCIIIGRSSVESLNIGTIMKSLGGGGHPGAGSAMLKSVNPDTIEEMIVELIGGNKRSSIQISDMMSFPVLTVLSDTHMKEVASILREKGCTGLPVMEHGRIVGIISRRDFRKMKRERDLNSPVKAYMSRNVLTIKPGTSPMEAARLMVKYDIGRLPVVEDDQLIGIVSRSDTMHYFYDLLPE